MNRPLWSLRQSEFIRFCCIGGFCTLLNIATLYLLVDILHLHYLLAVVIAYLAINCVGYILNKYFSFRSKTKPTLLEASKYYSIMLLSLAANLTLMYVLTEKLHIHYLFASLAVTLLFLLINFIGHKTITFRKPS